MSCASSVRGQTTKRASRTIAVRPSVPARGYLQRTAAGAHFHAELCPHRGMRNYKVDSATAKLTANTSAFTAVKPGSAPLRFSFHPNGKFE